MVLPESVQGMSVGALATFLVAVLTGIQFLTSADPIGRSLRLLRHPMVTKLESLMEFQRTVEGTFELDHRLTLQLKALRSSTCQNVDIVDMGDCFEQMVCYNLPTKRKRFMQLALASSNLYIRSGYLALYEAICQAWLGDNYRVSLIGNAGTGNSLYSLFQLYALRQLLVNREGCDYDFVIRQVGTTVFLIDLSDAWVYKWTTRLDHIMLLSLDLQRTLYFFEPGNDLECLMQEETKVHNSPRSRRASC